jgi:diguanylate cyclase (GGDEF)-like protein
MSRDIYQDIVKVDPLSLPLTASDALEEFLRHPDIDVLPVKKEKSLFSIYFKDCLPLLLGCSNGKNCKERVPDNLVKELCTFDAGLKDHDEFIASLKNAMECETSVAVSSGKVYMGMISVKKLVSYVHEHEIKEAIMVNPLTKMPGRYSIDKEFRLRSNAGPFVACYCDLDNFKAYNDKYGPGAGDQVLQYTGALLGKACAGHFAGHIGGDDFVLFLAEKDAESLLGKITKSFDTGVRSFYKESDRNRGYIVSTDRQRNLVEFPLMTMSIAVCSVKNKCEYDHVINGLAPIKKQAKEKSKTEGRSTYVYDRRVPVGTT